MKPEPRYFLPRDMLRNVNWVKAGFIRGVFGYLVLSLKKKDINLQGYILGRDKDTFFIIRHNAALRIKS